MLAILARQTILGESSQNTLLTCHDSGAWIAQHAQRVSTEVWRGMECNKVIDLRAAHTAFGELQKSDEIHSTALHNLLK